MESREYLGLSHQEIQQVAKYLQLVAPSIKPKVGIICGSGLGTLAESLENSIEVPYEDIPYFPLSTVQGHGGKLVFGNVAGVPVVCMKGRFHMYEGYPLWKVVLPVRVMRLMGAEYLIVTNAAGGINEEYKIGDVMVIRDHVNMVGLAGNSPLRGRNIDELGPRFPPMNKAYDRQLVKAGLQIAEKLGMAGQTHMGVYGCVGGPTYETIAELKMLKVCGVDAVGMSTGHEVAAGAHCGMRTLGISLISNKAILDYDAEGAPNHDEVVAAGKAAEERLKTFVTDFVQYLSSDMAATVTLADGKRAGKCPDICPPECLIEVQVPDKDANCPEACASCPGCVGKPTGKVISKSGGGKESDCPMACASCPGCIAPSCRDGAATTDRSTDAPLEPATVGETTDCPTACDVLPNCQDKSTGGSPPAQIKETAMITEQPPTETGDRECECDFKTGNVDDCPAICPDPGAGGRDECPNICPESTKALGSQITDGALRCPSDCPDEGAKKVGSRKCRAKK